MTADDPIAVARHCLELGHAGEAIAALQAILARDPMQAAARQLLGAVFTELGQPGNAADVLAPLGDGADLDRLLARLDEQTLATLAARHPGCWSVIHAHLARRDAATAREAYDALVPEMTRWVDVKTALERIAVLGDDATAIAWLETYLAFTPADIDATIALTQRLSAIGAVDRAFDTLETLLVVEPASERGNRLVHLLAQTYQHFERAVVLGRRTAPALPNDDNHNAHLALAEIECGDFATATARRDQFSHDHVQALARDPAALSDQAADALVTALVSTSDYAGARAVKAELVRRGCFDEGHRIQPSRPIVAPGSPGPTAPDGPARPIVLVASVRDEIEIIEAWLSWSFAHGIDAAIVQDNGSVDGTRQLLDQLARRWPILVLDEPCQDMNQSLWSTRMTWLAREALGADWAILSDADEFWLPRGGFAAAIAAATAPPFEAATILQIHQTMMLGEAEAGYGETGRFHDARLGLVHPLPRLKHQFLLPHLNLNAVMTPMPKVWVRTSALPLVLPGNHSAFSRDALIVPAPMIDCLHFSYRSFAHWRRKLQRWVESFGRSTAALDRDSAAMWQRTAAVIDDEAACRAFYHRTIFGTPYHRWLKQAGRIVERDEVRHFLANPVLPPLAPLTAEERARAAAVLTDLDQRLPRIQV